MDVWGTPEQLLRLSGFLGYGPMPLLVAIGTGWYGVYRVLRFFGNAFRQIRYGRYFPGWAKTMGVTRWIRSRIIFVLWLFFAVVLVRPVLNVLAVFEYSTTSVIAAPVISSILETIMLVLVIGIAVEMYNRRRRQPNAKRSFWQRWSYVVSIFQRRGISLTELTLAPIGLLGLAYGKPITIWLVNMGLIF